MVYEDEFHKEMRERSRANYHENGGRERTSIRRYLRRYKIEKKELLDYETNEEKLQWLRRYADTVRNERLLLRNKSGGQNNIIVY